MITVAEFKTINGITGTEQDALIESSISQAYLLLWSYIGYDLTKTDEVREYQYSGDPMDRQNWRRNFIHLPEWPVIEVVDVRDNSGAVVDPTSYRVLKRQGRIEFINGGLPSADVTTAHYRAGFDPLPDDIDMVARNLSGAIYSNGGTLQASANPLKSMTMFDAMSMSFDTTTATAGGAMGMLTPWAFVLDKYVVTNHPVLK